MNFTFKKITFDLFARKSRIFQLGFSIGVDDYVAQFGLYPAERVAGITLLIPCFDIVFSATWRR
jgi:hypothetical protein